MIPGAGNVHVRRGGACRLDVGGEPELLVELARRGRRGILARLDEPGRQLPERARRAPAARGGARTAAARRSEGTRGARRSRRK